MRDHQISRNQLQWQDISITILRISIGWHFLYEGLIKVTDPDWSSADFLHNSVGPFASIFKGIALNPTLLALSDFLNQWGLVLIGIGLILGLLSRWASLGGMIILGLYYVANPPFMGLADTSIAEGNYLIVNKNLIELFALWVIFQVPGSKVFGIDRFIGHMDSGNLPEGA